MKNEDLLEYYIEKYKIDTFFTDFDFWKTRMHLMTVPKKHCLDFINEYANHIVFLVKGQLKVHGNLYNGKSMIFSFCEAFMTLGEVDLLVESSSDVVMLSETLESCDIIFLDYSGAKDILLKDSAFLLGICNSLAEKTASFAVMQAVNTLQSAQAKVAVYILNTVNDNGFLMENQRIIAEKLNVSYRHLHRILKKFTDLGYLEHVEHYYKVIDRKALEMCAAEDM